VAGFQDACHSLSTSHQGLIVRPVNSCTMKLHVILASLLILREAQGQSCIGQLVLNNFDREALGPVISFSTIGEMYGDDGTISGGPGGQFRLDNGQLSIVAPNRPSYWFMEFEVGRRRPRLHRKSDSLVFSLIVRFLNLPAVMSSRQIRHMGHMRHLTRSSSMCRDRLAPTSPCNSQEGRQLNAIMKAGFRPAPLHCRRLSGRMDKFRRSRSHYQLGRRPRSIPLKESTPSPSCSQLKLAHSALITFVCADRPMPTWW
jgi:hypothetical protein